MAAVASSRDRYETAAIVSWMFSMLADACPCGHSEYREVASGVYGRGAHVNLAYRLFACRRCELVRTSPIPDPSIYDGLDFDDDGAIAREWLDDATAQDIADTLQRAMPDAHRVLDVGCNTGELVAGLRGIGWDASGCDIDQKAITVGQAQARDVFVSNPEIERIPGEYDGVTLIHTLEHTVNPEAMLSNLAASIVAGGVLHVRVPNYAGVLPRLMGNDWGYLMPFQHVWQFTPSTLAAMVLRTGCYELVGADAKTQLEPRSPGGKGAAKAAVGRLARLMNRGDEISATFRRIAAP